MTPAEGLEGLLTLRTIAEYVPENANTVNR
jgi:hypothetical protein